LITHLYSLIISDSVAVEIFANRSTLRENIQQSMMCYFFLRHGVQRKSDTFFYSRQLSFFLKCNKKGQLTLTNPRDAKACKNCSNSTCFVSFHRIAFPRISSYRCI